MRREEWRRGVGGGAWLSTRHKCGFKELHSPPSYPLPLPPPHTSWSHFLPPHNFLPRSASIKRVLRWTISALNPGCVRAGLGCLRGRGLASSSCCSFVAHKSRDSRRTYGSFNASNAMIWLRVPAAERYLRCHWRRGRTRHILPPPPSSPRVATDRARRASFRRPCGGNCVCACACVRACVRVSIMITL